MRNKRIEYIIDEILDQYAYADESTRPWIIGFSGGKDSTVLLMLVWIALEKLKELGYTEKEIINMKTISLYDEILLNNQ